MTAGPTTLFALDASHDLGAQVAARLGLPLAPHEARDFEWGQHKLRPLIDVRGHDVYVIALLHGDDHRSANDRLCRLLFFCAALRDADAGRVTAVVPYLCYARKDRQTAAFDPVTTRYVAQLVEAVGIQRVVTIEVHNPAAFQNAFRCPTVHVDPAADLAEALTPDLADGPAVVVSPDAGGVKRARHFADVLAGRLGASVPLAFVEKYRHDDVVTGGAMVGAVAGCHAVVVDDLIARGTTLAHAAGECRRAGALSVTAVAAHGAFVPGAAETLAAAPIDRLLVLDHLPMDVLRPVFPRERLRQVASAPLLARTIAGLDGPAAAPVTTGPPATP